jgi:hypothetical protein
MSAGDVGGLKHAAGWDTITITENRTTLCTSVRIESSNRLIFFLNSVGKHYLMPKAPMKAWSNDQSHYIFEILYVDGVQGSVI